MVKQQELSYDIKLVLTLVLLFLIYPVGLILMFKWMNWPKWLKIILSLPVIIIIIAFVIMVIGGFVLGITGNYNSDNEFQKTEDRINNMVYEKTCTKECASIATDNTMDFCVQKCIKELKSNK